MHYVEQAHPNGLERVVNRKRKYTTLDSWELVFKAFFLYC